MREESGERIIPVSIEDEMKITQLNGNKGLLAENKFADMVDNNLKYFDY